MIVACVGLHVTTSPYDVAQYAGRTLDMLNAIEKTLKVAVRDTDLIRAIASGLRSFAEDLHKVPPEIELDPEGRARELLRLAAAAALRSCNQVIRRCEEARADKLITDDDGIADCLDGLSAAFRDLHVAIEELGDAIDLHEALRSPVVGTYSNVEDLIASLKS